MYSFHQIRLYRSSLLFSSRFYILYQCFHIVKIIIITNDAVAMINDPILLIPLKALQEVILTISFHKLRKGVWLYFP